MPDFSDVVALCARWPEVTESLSYGTPALKVGPKAFCRLWGERDFQKADVVDSEVLVVFCELSSKEALLAESDGSVFTAPHYDGTGRCSSDSRRSIGRSSRTSWVRVIDCARPTPGDGARRPDDDGTAAKRG